MSKHLCNTAEVVMNDQCESKLDLQGRGHRNCPLVFGVGYKQSLYTS
jgi:hypothetical protein